VSPAVECMCDAKTSHNQGRVCSCVRLSGRRPCARECIPFSAQRQGATRNESGGFGLAQGLNRNISGRVFRVYRKLCNKGATESSFGRVCENCRFRADLRCNFLTSIPPELRRCLYSLHGVFQIGQRFQVTRRV
jgi:hypothetical protein